MIPLSLASEFPNDNSGLHQGAIWVCTRVCGEARAILRAPRRGTSTSVATPPRPAPAPELTRHGFDRLVSAMIEVATDRHATEPVALLGEMLSAPFMDAGRVPPPTTTRLVHARLFETTDHELRPTASFAATRSAWQGLLDGTTDDFSAVDSALLDQWAADLLCVFLGLGSEHKLGLRRALRAQGVAAFGLFEPAAA